MAYPVFSDLLIDAPTGVSFVIQPMQTDLNNLCWLDIAYGLSYKNTDSDGDKFPEIYIGNNEYREVLPDDSMEKGFVFFDADESETMQTDPNGRPSGFYTRRIRAVFWVKLDQIYLELNHRASEEIKRQAVQALEKTIYGADITGIVEGVSNVYGQYYTMKDSLINQHPYYCFAVEMDAKYRYDGCADPCNC